MNKKAAAIPAGLFLMTLTVFPIIKYKGLLPGSSTRAECERVLGKPIKEVFQGICYDYDPSEHEARRFSAIYDKKTQVLQIIHIYMDQKFTKSDFSEWLGLQEPSEEYTDDDGNLVMYFGSQGIALQFEGSEDSSPVSILSYFDPALMEPSNREEEKAVTQPKKSAAPPETGGRGGNYKLGQDYYWGRNGKPVNYERAFSHFLKAAEAGHARAQYFLGSMYASGLGTKGISWKNSRYWYRKAAEQGHPASQSELGYDLLARGSDSDDAAKCSEGKSWLKKAMDQGHAKAFLYQGEIYFFGFCVAKNWSKALSWWRQAADLGDAKAHYNIGMFYEEGNVVSKDYRQAFFWYEKGAQMGNPSCQFSLGELYEHGWGVERNMNQALKWYEKAAKQNHVNAFLKLQELKKR